jgi:hypothetical protein
MNVYKKLQIARLCLQEKQLKKTGKNKFSGYDYFELQDFLPTVQTIFGDTGLSAVFRCDADVASLTVYDCDNPESNIVFTAPMAAAELKGCHPIQNLGASISYLRRYLYVNALEIVEHDAVDAGDRVEPKAAAPKPKPKPAEPAVEAPKPAIQNDSATLQVPVAPEGDAAEWLNLVKDASLLALGFAEKQADVMQIFKLNKTLFDAVKETDEEFFKSLMAEFAKVKKQLEE